MKKEQQAEIARSITGSNLSTIAIISKVKYVTKTTREKIGPEINQMVQERNLPFDKAFPLIKDGFNEIATKYSMDPAVLFWIYMDWKKDYNQ
ncbi:hypothetical protein Z959_07885 [Clostridium novyi B str. ATCC 27606]|uniref:Uncharacterized protein n=1 Tax=Clostridium novyi B str. ATCC 27606 TaxID=1443123 RepID=A0AA40IUT1_CLONO|nr:hypothetical protein [Clostridium novyi]KEI16989.1 hypothetical protein Z959_07885 [Clostridium novyi B str. ATCC 27606]